VHDGGARWRAAPSGCPAGGGYPLPVLAGTCYGRCSPDRYKKKKKKLKTICEQNQKRMLRTNVELVLFGTIMSLFFN